VHVTGLAAAVDLAFELGVVAAVPPGRRSLPIITKGTKTHPSMILPHMRFTC
jgi:hypothetical protein